LAGPEFIADPLDGGRSVKLESFDDVQTSIRSKKRPFHLLLGNGFSMSYDPAIFSYNALYNFVEALDDEVLSKLFGIVNTKNFELVMRHLESFSELARAFDADPKFISQLDNARAKLKTSLILPIPLTPAVTVADTAGAESAVGR